MHNSKLVVASLVVLALGPSCDCSKNVTVEGNSGSIRIDSNELDFGPVTELTDAGRPIVVRNVGRAPLTITSVEIESDGGSEFTVASFPSSVPVSGEGSIAIDFSPLGSGEDFAVAVIRSDDPEQPEIRVSLHGGPIFPGLDFDPDGGFLTFVPTSMSLTQKAALLRSVGGSTLTVTSVGVSAMGNPDFSVVPPALPAVLRPGQSIAVTVEYSRSSRTAEGLMSVNSDDADAGRRTLRLIPDPAAACSDGVDNDSDGLADFPDDPGCSSPTDTDEFNDPQCVDGAARACGSSIGACRPGTQLCMLGAWYPCDGGTKMTGETCNGLDDDCDAVTDEEITELCTLNGCMGARACIPDSGVAGGQFGACIPINAGTETCNGVDDDCDGTIDDGITQNCMLNGCLGQRICVPGGDGGFTSCSVANPPTETCNGLDDDCDGTIDDVQPALQSCGFGVCARTIPACVDGGIPMCMPGMGSTEICNGIDDDCDGTADDGLGSSSCGMGACFRSVPACLADGGMNACVPGMQSAEICNNVDDDCDGPIDESLTRTCYTGPVGTAGVGICRSGTQTCSAGSWGATCPGEIVPQATENCSASGDENCNGQVNEGCDAGPCNPNGLFTRDGGALSYSCAFGLVNFSISQFQILSNGTIVRLGPAGSASICPGNDLSGSPTATCPSGSFSASCVYAGSCTETYSVTGTFVGPNVWQGTFTASYSGTCFGCANQSWPVQAFR